MQEMYCYVFARNIDILFASIKVVMFLNHANLVCVVILHVQT